MKREMRQDLLDKFILYLNSALAMENAALERVQRRIEQTVLEDVKQQLQRHLEETKQHQDRLRRIIRSRGSWINAYGRKGTTTNCNSAPVYNG